MWDTFFFDKWDIWGQWGRRCQGRGRNPKPWEGEEGWLDGDGDGDVGKKRRKAGKHFLWASGFFCYRWDEEMD
jgi:hypothetical protein